MELERTVAGFAAGAVRAYPDLDFLAPLGRLHLEVGTMGVTRVRIQLPGSQFLHLHSVSIEAEGVDDATAGANWRTSSVWPSFPRDPGGAILFDPDENHGAAFHTAWESQPWLEIALRTPVDLPRVMLRNVSEATCGRARGIQVLVATEDGDWETVYDGQARVRSFQRTMASAHAYTSEPVPEQVRALTRIMTDVSVGAFKQAQQSLKTTDALSPAEVKTFRKAVSTHLLAGRQLEWTIHGIKRSFRYWTEQEQRQYVALTVEVAGHLRVLSDNVCFGFGAVLAVVRDGALIPHDDDLDLIIGLEPHQAPTLADGLRLVRELLTPLGYTVGGKQLAHHHVGRRGSPRKIDVFVGLFEGDQIAWYPGARGSLDREMMFPPSTGPLLGLPCPLPRSPLVYLEKVYGPNWRAPDPGFAHRWRRTAYADIAGTLKT